MASSVGGRPIKRLPLARSRRRLKFERRIYLWLWLLALPALALTAALLHLEQVAVSIQLLALGAFLLAWALASSALIEQIVRPLQTLSNVVAALREDDYSFRARGARRDDALGDLALEINSLANTLQTQRVTAVEAVELLQRVVEAMATPVLTFDPRARLRLINPAGARVLKLSPGAATGRGAAELGLLDILAAPDEGVITLAQSLHGPASKPSRWMIRRSTFRQHGVKHTLILLSDVSSALREEERQAWQRLIRVLGHEINNSLAPIKSIAGSLRSRLPAPERAMPDDFERGLSIIEGRADSLNNFVQAYRKLAQLPAPSIRIVPIAPLIERVIHLETRMRVELLPAPAVDVAVDPDQIEQLMINLLTNAVEAAIDPGQDGVPLRTANGATAPQVQVGWSTGAGVVTIAIRDNGPGVTNASNLFVPFYTTKKNGTGVGLVLARQIAEVHGGTVSLSNRDDGMGCEALVHLPLAGTSK